MRTKSNDRENALRTRFNSAEVQERLNSIIDFMLKHKTYKYDYISSMCDVARFKSAGEKIRYVFLQALKASGGSNLSREGASAKKIFDYLKSLDSKTVNVDEFFKCFTPDIKSFDDLFKYLVDKEGCADSDKNRFPGFGKKKCALFLIFLDTAKEHIFSNADNFIGKISTKIAVDTVICFLLNKICGLSAGSSQFQQDKDFDLINDLTTSVENGLMIEDLWYWGYFNTKGSGNDRSVEFNDDKYYSDMYLYPSEQVKDVLAEFINVLNGAIKI